MTTLPVNKPTGVVNGDVMLATITTRDTAVTTLTGWNVIGATTNTAGTLRTSYFWKVAASEGASYTWTIGSSKASVTIIAFSGVDTTNPFISQSSQNNAATPDAPPAPAQVPGIANTFVVYSASIDVRHAVHRGHPAPASARSTARTAVDAREQPGKRRRHADGHRSQLQGHGRTDNHHRRRCALRRRRDLVNTGWSATLRPGS